MSDYKTHPVENVNTVRCGLFFLPLLAAFHLFAQPRNGMYQIQGGAYTECCGLLGNPFEYDLPYQGQAFIDLIIDRTRNAARMRILHSDKQTVFQPLPRFEFDDGLIFPDRIEFQAVFATPWGSGRYEYVIRELSAKGIILNGALHHPVCCDIPTEYSHTIVTASFMHATTLSIRAPGYPWTFEGSTPREVEVCWDTIANRRYQLQYLSPTNTWIDLGSPTAGTGSRRCLKQDVLAAPASRIYRVVTIQ